MQNGQTPDALLAPLTDEEIGAFEEFYRAAQQDQLDGVDDPYQAELDLIGELRARSQGEVDGVAWVPLAGGGLARIRRDQLEQLATQPVTAPGDDDTPSSGFQWRYLAGALAIAVLLFLALPRGDTPAAEVVQVEPEAAAEQQPAGDIASSAAQASVAPAFDTEPLGNVAVYGAELAQPTSLEVQGPPRFAVQVVPSAAELGGAWNPVFEPGTGAWLKDSTINIVVALPAGYEQRLNQLKPGTSIRLRLTGGSLRRYEVATTERLERFETEVLSQQRAGLTLIAAGTSGQYRRVVLATFIDD
jgi:hypothetical protein